MSDRTCSACERPPIARGYCMHHYDRERRAGRLTPRPQPSHEDLFWSKVNKDDDPNGCWIWMAYRTPMGYGQFGRMQMTRSRFAHRESYVLSGGSIPEGYEIDHLCRVTSCVNPDHLEPVTPRENRQRAVPFRDSTKPRRASGRPRKAPPLKARCGKGHEFNEENTSYYPDGGRRCKACHRDRERLRGRVKQDHMTCELSGAQCITPYGSTDQPPVMTRCRACGRRACKEDSVVLRRRGDRVRVCMDCREQAQGSAYQDLVRRRTKDTP